MEQRSRRPSSGRTTLSACGHLKCPARASAPSADSQSPISHLRYPAASSRRTEALNYRSTAPFRRLVVNLPPSVFIGPPSVPPLGGIRGRTSPSPGVRPTQPRSIVWVQGIRTHSHRLTEALSLPVDSSLVVSWLICPHPCPSVPHPWLNSPPLLPYPQSGRPVIPKSNRGLICHVSHVTFPLFVVEHPPWNQPQTGDKC
jgi:hypothetical protein